jgi:hypothetical protein
MKDRPEILKVDGTLEQKSPLHAARSLNPLALSSSSKTMATGRA